MKIGIYSIKDACNGFTQVFTASNNHSAIRMFGETAKSEGTMINKYPNDFDLYKIGEMEDENGNIVAECVLLERGISYANTKDKKE